MPSFTIPKGVEIPENLAEGEAFQTMATILLGKNGKAEVIEIDGVAIPGYEKKSKGKKLAERGEEEASRLATLLSEGRWTHDYPIRLEEARKLGLPVSDAVPELDAVPDAVLGLHAVGQSPQTIRAKVRHRIGSAVTSD